MFTIRFLGESSFLFAYTLFLLSSARPALAAPGCDPDSVDGSTHCYVTAQYPPEGMTVVAHGVGGLFTEPDQLAVSAPDYSIGQIALITDSGNTIELGWVVDPNRYNNDNRPSLFVTLRYHVSTRCVLASPNKTDWSCAGDKYVDFLSAKTHPGSVVGTKGQPMIYHVGYYGANECGGEPGWWIQYGDEWIGCVKESWWKRSLFETFANGQAVQWFGEVAYYTADYDCVPMGYGLYGTSLSSASVSNMYYETMQGSQSTASPAEAAILPSNFTQYFKADHFHYPPINNPKGFDGFNYGGPYGGPNSCGSAR